MQKNNGYEDDKIRRENSKSLKKRTISDHLTIVISVSSVNLKRRKMI